MNETKLPPIRQQGPNGKQQKSGKGLVWLATIASMAALVMAGISLWLSWPAPPPPEPVYADPGTYITYRDRELEILENVPINVYDEALFQRQEDGWVTYHGAQVGIDVSSHQKEIDWQQVAAAGIDFAMIRVGYRGYGAEGKIVLDTYYRENIEGALREGLDVGVYFFSQAMNVWEMEQETSTFLDAIKDYDITYPVVFDWEYVASSAARTRHITGEEVTLMTRHFCEIAQAAGYTPAVYFNQDMGYLHLDIEDLVQYPFWLAEYRTPPQFYYHFDMLQYTDRARVPGIEGQVDMNLSFVNFAE